MKILFLTPWYPDATRPNHGVFIRDQAAALAERHQVIVLSAKTDYTKFSWFSFSVTESSYRQVKEYRLVINRSFRIINQVNYFLISTWIAIRLCRSFSSEVIHGNIGFPGAFWSRVVSIFSGRPYIISEHTFIQNNFRSYFHKQLTLIGLSRARRIVTVSRKSADAIQQFCNVPIEVVPNIVDVSRFKIVEPPTSGIFHIGFIGRLSSDHVKGLDLLLTSLSGIDENYKLHIVGDGNYQQQYQELAKTLGIEGKCKFYGFLSETEIPDFLNQLHFFVNCSRFETFGIAIVEAMASGLPVVCVNNGGPADFVTESNGILVKDRTVESLRAGLLEMMKTYSTYDRNAIRARVENQFSAQAFVSRMDEVYARI